MTTAKKALFGVGSIVAVLVGAWLVQVVKAAIDAKKAGLLDDVETEKYRVGRENNLKAIHAALLLSAESEGKLPDASTWMDQALIRLKTSDISEEEAKSKLRVPGVSAPDYGYAINDSVAGKSSAEIKSEPKTVLVFESKEKAWNAHGDPKKDGVPNGKCVLIDGTVGPLGG